MKVTSIFGLFIIFSIDSVLSIIHKPIRFTASSFKPNHEPEKAWGNTISLKTEHAWCPKSKIGTELKEWIQIDFAGLIEFKMIALNGYSDGNNAWWIKQFYFKYRRDNSSKWHQATDVKGNELFKGSASVVDTRFISVKSFFANTVRIYPYNDDKPTFDCLAINIVDARNKSDGVIEYRTDDGDGKFQDCIYDGELTNKSLINGIGVLSDDKIADKSGLTCNGLVGWSNETRKNNFVTVWFKFDQIYKFKEISFYMQNNYQEDCSVFSKVQIESSVAGKRFNYYAKPVTERYIPDRKLLSPRWANVSLLDKNLTGQYIKLNLFFGLKWMKLSEITFKADPYLEPIEAEPEIKSNVKDFQKRSLMNYNYLMYILAIICFLIITFACMGFLLLRMRSKRMLLMKSSGIPIGCSVSNHSPGAAMFPQVTNGHLPHVMYNGGGGQVEMMHNGNYIINGANGFPNGKPFNGYVDNNNGTLMGTMQHGHMYKPVANNGFGCMNSYESQTFNFRKTSSNSASTLQGTMGQHQYFGTLKPHPTTNLNNNGSINGCGTMIPNSNHNNSAAMTPLLNGHNFPNNNITNNIASSGNNNVLLYPTENKRASYDGSYAGTGSNGEYSTTSMIREPITMTSLPPPPTSTQQSQAPSAVVGTNPYAIQPCLFNYPNIMEGPPPPPIQIQHPHQQQDFNNDYYYGSNGGHGNHNTQPLPSWSEQVQMIVKNHLGNHTPLESPVGGSLIIPHNQKPLDPSDSEQLQESIQRSEQVIMDNTTCLEKDDLDIHNCIGVGQLGKIYKAKYKGSSVIVKALYKECDKLSRHQFLQAVTDLLHISCNNLTKVIGYCKYSPPDIEEGFESVGIVNYILTEDTKYTDLCTFIKGHNSNEVNTDNSHIKNEVNSLDDYDEAGARMNLSQSCLVYISTQISDGMSVLEQEGLLHRDLSARNCLLGPRLSVLITDTAMTNPDFYKDYMKLELDPSNTATATQDDNGPSIPSRNHVLLPLRWMSPEAALWAQYSFGSDIWSFGVVLWEILTGCTRRPFDAIQDSIDESGSSGILMNHMLLLSSNQQPPTSNDSSALLPSNETLNQILNKHSQIPNQNDHQSYSVISREIRDLIHSCWSINVADRPKFADISTFLRRKINGFNADEEYQALCMKTKNSLNNNVQTVVKSF